MFRLNCRRLARSSSFFCYTCCSPEPPRAQRGLNAVPGNQSCAGGRPWGCFGVPKKVYGVRSGEKQGEGCCQQVPPFLDLLRLKVTLSLGSWGTSFEVSFPSLPEAGFRPCPCFSYMIPCITVCIYNITPGTQRGKDHINALLYIQVLLFFKELSETSIFTVA